MTEQNREPDGPHGGGHEGSPNDPTAPVPQWQQPTSPLTPPPADPPYGAPTPPPPPAPYPASDQAPYGGAPYGGPPDSGTSAPYGAPDAPYGAPPPGYYQQAPSQTNTSALVLTILSGLGIFMCCGVTIVSLILGIVALTKQAADPAGSAKLTKWGWIAFAAGFVLAILGAVLYIGGMIALSPEFSSEF